MTRRHACFLAAAAGLLPAVVATDAQAVTLAISVPTPASFSSPIGPAANVQTTGGSVSVTALGAWELRIRGSDGGRLRSTGTGVCANGSSLLTNPLRVWASGSGVTSPGSSQNPIVLSGSPQLLASGSVGGLVAVAVPVTITYRHVPSPEDQLPAACPYSLTAIIDVSA